MCRYGYQKELFLLLEKLTRDMDKKIERQKERAEKESEPRALTPDDQRRLDEILVSILIQNGLQVWGNWACSRMDLAYKICTRCVCKSRRTSSIRALMSRLTGTTCGWEIACRAVRCVRCCKVKSKESLGVESNAAK